MISATRFFPVCVILHLLLVLPAAAETIGVIQPGEFPYGEALYRGFTEELARQGYGPDKVDIIVQRPAPSTMSWVNVARKFAVLEVDAVVAFNGAITLTVMEQTEKIPLVYAAVFDPAAVGISGRNVTGVSSKVPLVGFIRNLKRITNFSNLGVVYSEIEADTGKQVEEIRKFEEKVGFTTVKYNVEETNQDIELPQVDTLLLTTSSVAAASLAKIMAAAGAAKIPVASLLSRDEELGIIFSFAANPEIQGKEAANMAAAILNGAEPGTINVAASPKVEMVINLKKAKELGLSIPFDLLGSAKVIK